MEVKLSCLVSVLTSLLNVRVTASGDTGWDLPDFIFADSDCQLYSHSFQYGLQVNRSE